MLLEKLFNKKKKEELKEIKNWNTFIDKIVIFPKTDDDLKHLNHIQKNAVLCFIYDSEVQNGGHDMFFSIYPNISYDDVYHAILEVSNKEFAENFKLAMNFEDFNNGIEADYFYMIAEPTLIDYLEKYVENNIKEILNKK